METNWENNLNIVTGEIAISSPINVPIKTIVTERISNRENCIPLKVLTRFGGTSIPLNGVGWQIADAYGKSGGLDIATDTTAVPLNWFINQHFPCISEYFPDINKHLSNGK